MHKTKMRLKQKLKATFSRMSARDKEMLGNQEACVASTSDRIMEHSFYCLPLLWMSLCMGTSDLDYKARDEALNSSNGAKLLHHILSEPFRITPDPDLIFSCAVSRHHLAFLRRALF
jgi:hypothetical protein